MPPLASQGSLVDFLHQDVLPRLSIEDVYRDVAFVSRQGRRWRAACPMHGGRDPNFSVDSETLAYTCFSHCGSGSALTFLNGGEVPRGPRFVELVRELAGVAGVEFPERSLDPAEVKRQEAARRRVELLEGFATAAGERLLESPTVLAYLAGRGFVGSPPELVRAGLGVAPDLRMLAHHTRASPAELVSIGLGMAAWEGRLTVTWRDRWRRIGTFAAREVTARPSGPKYLYLKDAPRPPYFGIDRFGRGRTPSRVLIVEGMLDVIQLGLLDVDGVLATGSALPSERHITALVELGVEAVVLALDSDDAGLQGTRQFIGLARRLAPDLRLFVIPRAAMYGSKDPGELAAASGRQGVSDMIAARWPAAVFQADALLAGVQPNSAIGDRRDALRQLTELADQLVGRDRDADLEDLVLMGIESTGYAEDVIRSHLGLPLSASPVSMVSDSIPTYHSTSVTPAIAHHKESGSVYQAEISRRNPTAFVFLVDQSSSMAHPFGGDTRASFLATVVNRQIAEMVLRCSKDEGIRDYFHVSVIGYGSDVHPALHDGTMSLIPISEIAGTPLRVEERRRSVPDGAGGLVDINVKFPIWVDPVADGATAMCEAIRATQDLLAEWIEAHPDSFPPTIINVTDGASTDGDPTEPASDLASLATRDGNVLLYNVHISEASGAKIEFPTDAAALADPLAKQLYSISSELPPYLVEAASTSEAPVRQGARGLIYNADPASLTRFLTIGTRPAHDPR